MDKSGVDTRSTAVRKIVFLGDANVGKTSLIARFVSNSMPSNA